MRSTVTRGSALQSCAERWRLRNGFSVGHHAHTALEHVWSSQWLLQWLASASTYAVDCWCGRVNCPPLPPVARRVLPETLGEL